MTFINIMNEIGDSQSDSNGSVYSDAVNDFGSTSKPERQIDDWFNSTVSTNLKENNSQITMHNGTHESLGSIHKMLDKSDSLLNQSSKLQTEIPSMMDDSCGQSDMTLLGNFSTDTVKINDIIGAGDGNRQLDNDFKPISQVFQASDLDVLQGPHDTQNEVKFPALCRPTLIFDFDPIYNQPSADKSIDSHGDKSSPAEKAKSDSDLIDLSTPSKKQERANKHKGLKPNALSELDKEITNFDKSNAPPAKVAKYSQEVLNNMVKNLELKYNSIRESNSKAREPQRQQLKIEIAECASQISREKDAIRELKTLLRELNVEEQHNKESESSSKVNEIQSRYQQVQRDIQTMHTYSSEIHRRYDSARASMTAMQTTQNKLKENITLLDSYLHCSQLQIHAIHKKCADNLECHHMKMDNIQKEALEKETFLDACIKKKAIECESMRRQIEQKDEENTQLLVMYDELLAKLNK